MTFSLEMKKLHCCTGHFNYYVWGVVIGNKQNDVIEVEGVHLDSVIIDNGFGIEQMYSLNEIQMQNFALRIKQYPQFYTFLKEKI